MGQAQKGLKPVRMLGGQAGARHWRLWSCVLLVLAQMRVATLATSVVSAAFALTAFIPASSSPCSCHRSGHPQDARNSAFPRHFPAGIQNGMGRLGVEIGFPCSCIAQDVATGGWMVKSRDVVIDVIVNHPHTHSPGLEAIAVGATGSAFSAFSTSASDVFVVAAAATAWLQLAAILFCRRFGSVPMISDISFCSLAPFRLIFQTMLLLLHLSLCWKFVKCFECKLRLEKSLV